MTVNGGMITSAPVSTIAITTTSPVPNCAISTPYSFNFNATGGVAPYTWSLFSGSLQPGLSLSSAGVLAGTCTNSSGTVTFTVQVCDSEATPACTTGVFQQTAQNTPPPTLGVCDSSSSPSCPNPPSTGVVGTFYSYNFSAIGGTAPYSWAVTSGGIPSGLMLTSAGVLSGFPSSATSFSFTVQVTDSTMPTPETATASFSVTITGFSGNPAVAKEPQSWTTAHQGGVNTSTGNPCAQTDAAGACTWNLPKVCTSGNNCRHEQLGFGTNDHPATLPGLYQAGCDWTGLAQNQYLWVEVKKTSVLTAAAPYTSALFGNPAATYVAPVKMAGLTTPMPTGLSCAAATSTPIGPYSLAGSVTSGTFVLGEQFKQQVSNASANLLHVTCTLGSGAHPAPWIAGSTGGTSPVLPNCSDAGDAQTGPFSLGMFTGGSPDSNNAHTWIGQTSGAVFTQSAQAATNGYFRLTGECDDLGTNVPCNNLSDEIPCFHSVSDASIVWNPLCSNDLPSMFTIEASTIATNNSNQLEQDGNNTSLSGFELTFMQGQNQSLPGGACPSGVNCGFSPQLYNMDCTACGHDHIWVHGWDPGDPALHTGDPSQLSFSNGTNPINLVGGITTPRYPVTPGTSPAQYNCPGWAWYSTAPPGGNGFPNLTIALSASSPYAPYNQIQYANGCGDDVVGGIVVQSGGYTWSEMVAATKIHKNNTETHVEIIGNAANNLNPNGAGINGPHRISQALFSGASEAGIFVGGTPVNPISGVALNLQVTEMRAEPDPSYRYLSAGSGHSPLASGGYGCGDSTPPSGTVNVSGISITWVGGTQFSAGPYWVGVTITIGGSTYIVASVPTATSMTLTTSAPPQSGAAYQITGTNLPNICPMVWAAKKNLELKWCIQCLVDGFILEYMWPDGQTGEIATMDVRVCSGGDDCLIVNPDGTPTTATNDITISNGIMRASAGGLTVAPRSGDAGNGGGTSQGQNRVHFFNILLYNLDQIQYGGSKGGDALNWGTSGNSYVSGVATRTSNVASVTFAVGTVAPNPLSYIQLCGPTGVCTIPPGQGGGSVPNGSVYINFNGQREDPISPQTCVAGVCTPGATGPCLGADNVTVIPCGTMVFSGGTYDPTWQVMIGAAGLGTFDCRTITAGDCVNTKGSTNIWAPMCDSGIGSSSTMMGSACHNCGSAGNAQCPPFGCGDLACVTGTELATDNVCTGTGSGAGPPAGCGPANATFQTYAFSILDISPGDIAYLTNCSDSSFNTPLAGLPNTYACTAGVNGCGTNQNPVSLTVLYPNVGPNVASGVTGCQITNAPSWQRNFIADHIGVITGGQAQLNATLFGIKTQQENNQLTNSYFYFGGLGHGLYCGGNPCTNGEANHKGAGGYSPYQSFDQTTNQIHHNAFMLPTTTRAAYYTAVGLLGSTICPGDPIPGNCGGSSTAVLTPFCTGSSQNFDSNSNPLCMGFTGWMSTSSFPSSTYNGVDCSDPVLTHCPLTSPPFGTFDYHNFTFYSATSFFASSSVNNGPTTDGFQIGPCIKNGILGCLSPTGSMVSIDQALTRSIYACSGPCGTGPWQD